MDRLYDRGAQTLSKILKDAQHANTQRRWPALLYTVEKPTHVLLPNPELASTTATATRRETIPIVTSAVSQSNCLQRLSHAQSSTSISWYGVTRRPGFYLHDLAGFPAPRSILCFAHQTPNSPTALHLSSSTPYPHW